ncbi:Csu type fimbrial protein [Paraburkholderia elongata]|uniref:Fimbrial major subunit CsuA/B family protein n=1 Tax=Paraburkholderia elongata TaxID=2675747 RepID=A0A972NKG0_9BURK|nr:spore coat U domain-containing protein [Paraburkholderia elongata]NPT53884.1 fimbrial major subunit CsuA/B family protein [Paraburkholderia elongata]
MRKACRNLWHWLPVAVAIGTYACASHADAATCSVTSSSGVDFGGYDPLSGTPMNGVATVQVTCDKNATVTLSISGQSGFGNRKMTGASDVLNYQLYTDTTRQTIWGDGTGGTQTMTLNLKDNPRVGLFTIYGQVPGGQDVSVGAYNAMLIMTLSF